MFQCVRRPIVSEPLVMKPGVPSCVRKLYGSPSTKGVKGVR